MQHSEMQYEIQTDPLKQRVWVHASDGSTVARFDVRFGMDIHNTVSAQIEGKGQCLHCTHTRPTPEEWGTFRQEVRALWGIEVPEDAVVIDTAGPSFGM